MPASPHRMMITKAIMERPRFETPGRPPCPAKRVSTATRLVPAQIGADHAKKPPYRQCLNRWISRRFFGGTRTAGRALRARDLVLLSDGCSPDERSDIRG